MKPVIGVTTYGRNEKAVTSVLYNEHYAVPVEYVDALRRAGGVPVLLPPGEVDVARWDAVVDGYVLTGGTDIDPTLYGGNAAHPALLEFSGERDRTELALIRYLLEQSSKPVLFVCRGMQMLNVVMGGTLHEHLPDARNSDIHRDAAGNWAMQAVAVMPGSALGKTMQADTVTTFSGHHQAVKDLAKGVYVTAEAEDGTIEALELDGAGGRYFLAVQWHPEMSAATDASQQRLFDRLVEVSRQS